jgi:ankyrin repeat protein
LAKDSSDRPSTPLMAAIRGRHADAARVIAQRIEQQHERDWGLQFATWIGDTATIEALLECGADVDATGKYDGRTPMMSAVAQQREDLAALLLRWGADLNQPYRSTPLMLAVMQRDPVMAEWLIRAGADLTVTDHAGRTALSLAEEVADERLVALLFRETGRAAGDAPP